MAGKTEAFRHQHEEVRTLVARLESRLTVRAITNEAETVVSVARELFGKFAVHLAIEDATLYPRLTRHADGNLRRTATRFEQEMGGLKQRFEDYRHQWPGPTAISQDVAGFLADSRAVLAALKERIGREDAELYRLYDEAG